MKKYLATLALAMVIVVTALFVTVVAVSWAQPRCAHTKVYVGDTYVIRNGCPGSTS